MATSQKPPSKPSGASSRKYADPPLFAWWNRVGMPGTVIGFGGTMMGFQFFWAGYSLALLGVLALVMDVWSFRRRLRKHVAPAIIAVILTGSVYISYLLIVPAPLSWNITLEDTQYADGSDVLGIKWRKDYTELHFVFTDDSRYDYSDVDIQIFSRKPILNVGFYKGPDTCTASPVATWLADAKLKNPATGLSFLLYTGYQPMSENLYEIRCDKMYRRSKIEGILILPHTKQGDDEQEYWAIFHGQYVGALRSRDFNEKKCFFSQDNCRGMPDRIADQPGS